MHQEQKVDATLIVMVKNFSDWGFPQHIMSYSIYSTVDELYYILYALYVYLSQAMKSLHLVKKSAANALSPPVEAPMEIKPHNWG